MTDLTDWLAEQHAADERVARAAECPYGPWEHPHEDDGELNEVTIFPERGGAIIVATTTANDEGHAEAAHIARHDPQSVARIEGERAVLRIHWNDDGECDACSGNWLPQRRPGERQMPPHYPCPTLRALAWGYRGRDGWRSQWAPEGVSADA